MLATLSMRALGTVLLRKTATLRAVQRLPAPSQSSASANVIRERAFSSYSSNRATKNADPYRTFVENFRKSPEMAKLAESPEAMAALRDIAVLMKSAGVDFSAKPSMYTMMRLSANAEFRTAAKRVMEEFEKAGVKINSENAMSLFTGIRDDKM